MSQLDSVQANMFCFRVIHLGSDEVKPPREGLECSLERKEQSIANPIEVNVARSGCC